MTPEQVKLVQFHPAYTYEDFFEGYRPAPGVLIVSRDRTDVPMAGIYNICYVNAFQTQATDTQWWRTRHRSMKSAPSESVKSWSEFSSRQIACAAGTCSTRAD